MPNPAKADRRIQFDVLPERLAELDSMMEKADIRTRKELFDHAFTLLEWAMEAAIKGEKVASYNRDTDHVEIIRMPVLENAARRARTLHSDNTSDVRGQSEVRPQARRSHLSVAS